MSALAILFAPSAFGLLVIGFIQIRSALSNRSNL